MSMEHDMKHMTDWLLDHDCYKVVFTDGTGVHCEWSDKHDGQISSTDGLDEDTVVAESTLAAYGHMKGGT